MNKRIAKKILNNYIFATTRARIAAKAKAPNLYESTMNKIRKEREVRAAQLGITQGIFPGDIVQVKESSMRAHLKGKVTSVLIGLDSSVRRGVIVVEVIERNAKEWPLARPGELEHFVHFGWENTLEVVKEKA